MQRSLSECYQEEWGGMDRAGWVGSKAASSELRLETDFSEIAYLIRRTKAV